jgi:hypothetical protein
MAALPGVIMITEIALFDAADGMIREEAIAKYRTGLASNIPTLHDSGRELRSVPPCRKR